MITLQDYRRTVFGIYRFLRNSGTNTEHAYRYFRQQRNDLFSKHQQSPLNEDQKSTFNGLTYHNYNPAYRILVTVDTNVAERKYQIDVGHDGIFTIRQFGKIKITLPSGSGELGLFWIEGYGGGIFLPFRDSTNNNTTYGGGRYLLDTIKGADLGMENNQLILDFNYAYHPSCYYNPRWTCPLAPPQNTLDFPVNAGEKRTKSLELTI